MSADDLRDLIRQMDGLVVTTAATLLVADHESDVHRMVDLGAKAATIVAALREMERDAERPTLRDQFALAALQSNPSDEIPWMPGENDMATKSARAAYAIADAMLAKRRADEIKADREAKIREDIRNMGA